MIIIGEMNLTLKKGVGQFFCPFCLEQRGYIQRRIKRFLTLYFVPVVPLATVSEHVRCDQCRQTFPLDALGKTKEFYARQRRLEFAGDVRRVMVLLMLADGQVEEVELAAIRRVYAQLSGEDISYEQLSHDVVQAQRARVDATQYARAVSLRRTEEEKEWILRGAFLVASASGPLSPQRLDQLKSLPAALNISEERFREVIAQTA